MEGESSVVWKEARSVRRGVVLVLVSAISFGGLPIFAKLAYAEGVHLNTLLTLRFLIAAAVILMVWAMRRRTENGTGAAIGRAEIVPLVAMGAIGYVGQSFAYFTAVSIISATATSLLLYTYPILVTVLAWFIFKERITAQKLAALALACLGTLLVLRITSTLFDPGSAPGLGDLDPGGVAWALVAAIIYAGYILAGARYTAGIPPLFSSGVIISSTALTYAVWGTMTGELRLEMTGLGILWVTGLALVATVVAITTFFAGLSHVGPSRAAIISTLEPTVTVFLAGMLLSETITVEQLLGGALILASILALQIKGRSPTLD
jgi:drug/metabolite transporter (DMT)-like permease